LTVGGASMLARVLAAAMDAVPRIVVGPRSLAPSLPPDVVLTSEEPPGGGPVAAIAAGLDAVGDQSDTVAILAADLPFLTAEAIAALHTALSTADCAVYVDDQGRRQLLCGVWRVDALRGWMRVLGDPAGQPVRRLVTGLAVAEVVWPADGPPPWYDCDTQSDLAQAREWT